MLLISTSTIGLHDRQCANYLTCQQSCLLISSMRSWRSPRCLRYFALPQFVVSCAACSDFFRATIERLINLVSSKLQHARLLISSASFASAIDHRLLARTPSTVYDDNCQSVSPPLQSDSGNPYTYLEKRLKVFLLNHAMSPKGANADLTSHINEDADHLLTFPSPTVSRLTYVQSLCCATAADYLSATGLEYWVPDITRLDAPRDQSVFWHEHTKSWQRQNRMKFSIQSVHQFLTSFLGCHAALSAYPSITGRPTLQLC